MSDAPQKPTSASRFQRQQDAQARADRIRAFREELGQLEKDGVLKLGAEQQGEVQAYHARLLEEMARHFDIDTSDAQKRMSWGMRLASFLGAVALCASVWFFFYRIWGTLTTPMQVGLPIVGTLIALALTEVFARLERSGYLAGLTALIALACFVLNLSVVGYVFNVEPTENALLAWGTLGIILAYSYSLRVPLAAGLLLLMAFAVAKAGSLQGSLWSDPFWRLPEYAAVAGAAAFVAPLAMRLVRPDGGRASFAPVYRLFGGLVMFIALLVLGFWGEGSCLTRLDPDTIEELYQVMGLVLAGAAIGVGLWKRWNEVINLGGAFFFVFLYVKFFDWWWDWMPKYLFFLIFGIAALGALLIIKLLRSRLARISS
ncbi:MAG: DUF2157 domain-containing protein [Acidobacteriota bacterium]|nr:MAG: DUF2157 domain-containing protein [Acidobacteriota bacterium]